MAPMKAWTRMRWRRRLRPVKDNALAVVLTALALIALIAAWYYLAK
jgi:hypothetical protein